MRFILRVVLAFSLFPLFLSAQNNNQQVRLLNLEQDVQIIQRDLSTFRLEIENLIRENTQLRKELTASKNTQYATLSNLSSSIENIRAEFNRANKVEREAIITQVSAQIERLAKQTQEALTTLSKAVDARPQSTPQVVSFSNDYPKNGITYTIKSGDTLGRIARENNSSIDWIRNANSIPGDVIHPGQELFIPQK